MSETGVRSSRQLLGYRLDDPCPRTSSRAVNDSRGTAVTLAAFLGKPAAPWQVPPPGVECQDLVFTQMTFVLMSHLASIFGDDLTRPSH